ncbi:MAG: hypothetical protein HYV29_15440 [Ignavibacteriales bacterium]|nr:hypothetical protein [Ignavibacteriales bacterium]
MNLRYVVVLFFPILFTSIGFAAADSLVYSFNFSDTTKYDKSLSYDIDLKSQPGNIILAPGKAKNLASGSIMKAIYAGPFPLNAEQKPDTNKINAEKLHDNNFFTYVEFPVTASNIGSQVKIDLRVVRVVDSIVVIGLGNLASTGYQLRPIAFSYYAGVDTNNMSRIFQEFNNLDSARHVATIPDAQPIRYITFEIDKQHPNNSTVISEFRIFGQGYVVEAAYVSNIDSVGMLPANFANVFLDADIPTGTTVSFEMRTGSKKTYDSTSWSNWSSPIQFLSSPSASEGAQLLTAEPRRFFQYRVSLRTSTLETPKVRSVKFVYQQNLIADSTSARITPDTVDVLTISTLTYSIFAKFSGSSLGIDGVKIQTPSPSSVRNVTVNGVSVAYSHVPSSSEIVIEFAQTVSSTSTIDITFATKLIRHADFPSIISNKSSTWNPQTVDPNRSPGSGGWSVIAAGVPRNPLVDVVIDPNPFTPNNDGRNDITVIDFSVTKIEVPKPLRIKIFDLTGRKIRTIADLMSGVNPYFGDPRKGGSAFLWDGKDDNGKVVRPGVYILQVSLDVDDGGFVVTKSVVVAY